MPVLKDLTKKSRWKLTQDCVAYVAFINQWGLLDIKKETVTAPTGTEFVVPDKQTKDRFVHQTYNKETCKYTTHFEKSGLYFIVELQEGKALVFFNDIKDSIELLEQPKDVSYFIRDKNTAALYVCEVFRNEDVKKSETVTVHCSGRYHYSKQENDFTTTKELGVRWAKTPGSAKKFKDIGQLKNRLLVITGYFNGISESLSTYRPLMQIPDNWEAVEYDKVSGEITVLELDLHQYVKDSFEVRNLTRKFGSASRELYKKLSVNNELKDYPYFLMFNAGDVNTTDNAVLMRQPNAVLDFPNSQYDNQAGHDQRIIESEIKAVKKLAYKDLKKSIKTDSACFALPSDDEAWTLILGYTGNLQCKIVNMQTLQEVLSKSL